MLENPELLLLIIPVLIFSIVIHEMAHGYAALFQGDPTARDMGRLTLNPLVHLDPIWSVVVPALLLVSTGFFFGMAKPVMYNPANFTNKKWGEAIVAIAGPISNIVIALIFALMIRAMIVFDFSNELVITGMFFVVVMNILLAILNMIPIPPLDGSKMLFAFLKPGQQHIRNMMEQYQLVLMLGLLFVLFNTSFLGEASWRVAALMVG